jgi:hypothetical protein
VVAGTLVGLIGMAVRNIERCLNSARSAVDCHHVPDFSPYFGPDIVPDQPNL